MLKIGHPVTDIYKISVSSLKGDHIHVHKNLAFNMGAVTLIFLFGADQTDNKVTSKFCLLNQTLIVEVFGYV